MKKRMLMTLLMLFLALQFATGALASVSATPNQRLAFRTGPNTKYVELYTMPPSTSIRAIEYEEGNGVTWVLVEFRKDGKTVRAYTGLKRMTVNGSISWASHLDQSGWINIGGDVLAAPSSNGAYRGHLHPDDYVTILDYEGDYVYIEFYDNGTPSRGYVPSWMMEDDSSDSYDSDDDYTDYDGYDHYDSVKKVPAWPNQELAFRTGPNTKYVWLYHMPQSTSIKAIEYEEGNDVTWVLVEFKKNGQVVRGYTGLKRMSVNGSIPWAYHINRRARIDGGGTVYAAPSGNAAYRGKVRDRDAVTLLRYEGAYAYIEFNDGSTPSRGYVSSWMIDWGSGHDQSSSGMSSSDKNLSNFAYRKVSSKGRGSLVFQKSPRGEFMSGHKFYDGNWIYVNVNYRKDGYSIAYEDGEYGYVDASYIDWDSHKRGSSSSSGSKPSSKSSSKPGSKPGGGNDSVTFTGNVNVRSGPGLDYSIIGEVSSNQSLSYAGSTRYDDRGVAWYSVHYNGRTGWVSSKYSKRRTG